MNSHDTNNQQPQRNHLRRLPEILIEPAVFLITICTDRRNQVLKNMALAQMTIETLREVAEHHQWRVGNYVVMPDHIHFFCTTDDEPHSLSSFISAFKSITTRRAWQQGISGRMWQPEFHDHLLRTQESYREKVEYVRRNPVRAGLCEHADDYRFSGNIHDL